MKTQGKTYYVGTHHNSFREGEPAEILGVANCIPDINKPSVACFHVKYADGYEDYCPISDTSNYKVLTEEKVTIKFTEKI